MTEWLADWAGSIRHGVVTVLAVTFITSGSVIFSAIQGHASDADLAIVDEASKSRDAELRRVLERHLEDVKEDLDTTVQPEQPTDDLRVLDRDEDLPS